MSLKKRLDRLESEFSDLALMRRGDRAAAERLLRRECREFIEDIARSISLYTAEVERIIADASDDIATAYRAAWDLVIALFAAEDVGDEARAAQIGDGIGDVFAALPDFNGRSIFAYLDDVYHEAGQGFKLAEVDLDKIADLLYGDTTERKADGHE